MLEQQLRDKLNIDDSVGVLQLNCKHSKYVTHSLFNSSLSSLFLVISVQEPYVNPIDNLPLNHPNWTLVCPTPRSVKEEDRPRACLYIRQDLSPIINPIFSPSRKLAASSVTIKGFTVLVASVYNPQKTLECFEALTDVIRTAPLATQLLPTLCTADANLHCPLWDPSHSKQNDKLSDSLIDILTEWGLRLRSPIGVPTFGVRSANTEGTSIDQVWVDEGLDDAIISCFIDESDLVNHHSDHQALITVFSAESGDKVTSKAQAHKKRNWHKVNVVDLKRTLTASLPKLRPLVTRKEIEFPRRRPSDRDHQRPE